MEEEGRVQEHSRPQLPRRPRRAASLHSASPSALHSPYREGKTRGCGTGRGQGVRGGPHPSPYTLPCARIKRTPGQPRGPLPAPEAGAEGWDTCAAGRGANEQPILARSTHCVIAADCRCVLSPRLATVAGRPGRGHEILAPLATLSPDTHPTPPGAVRGPAPPRSTPRGNGRRQPRCRWLPSLRAASSTRDGGWQTG
jgi:hypothetical protein